MALQLWQGTRTYGEAAAFDDRLRQRLPRIVAASVAMGVVIWGLMQALGGMLYQPGTRYLALLALVTGGMAAYAVAGVALGAFRPSDLKAGLRRQR